MEENMYLIESEPAIAVNQLQLLEIDEEKEEEKSEKRERSNKNITREEITIREKLIRNTNLISIQWIKATPRKGAMIPLNPIRVKSMPW